MIQKGMKTKVVGVDVGYDITTCAIVDIRGKILARDEFPTTDYPNINEFVSVLSERIVVLAEGNGGYEEIRSMGISVSSGNFMTGCIENSPNMVWKGVVPLAAMMRDRTGLAVAVANNAHVRALGEYAFGCAHGMRDFITLTLGYGLGSCFFSNGQIHLGADGFAGEVGHTCVVDGGRECTCGRRGCLEAYCSHRGLIQTARELLAGSDRPSLMREVSDRLTPALIEHFCDQGDELSIEAYRLTGVYLGLGLANYASCLDPEAIVFTGGLARAGKWLLSPAYDTFNKHVFHNISGKVKFLTSALTDVERDLLGASALAWDVKEYSLFK